MAYEDMGIPKLRDGLKMEDEVSVTLPAWVWAIASVQLQGWEDATSYVGAIIIGAQEEIMHPAWLKARRAERHEEMENHQKAMEAIQKTVFRLPEIGEDQ